MVENDTLMYHVKKPLIEQKSRSVHSLITQERTRKLELLIHLISNSRQALIVCGPEGIGKSTLLKALREHKAGSWLYCLVQGTAVLSLGMILEQTTQLIKQNFPEQQSNTLTCVYRLIESQHKKIVLIIDEAGHLAPGLINTLIEYSEKNPVLRVIFVLTHDDLYMKNSSDSAIDDCHLIEIPPLSEKQCGEFLQYLSTKPRSQVTFNEINDSIIEAVYSKTHGIPGRIIAELPSLEGVKQSNNSLLVLVAAVAGLVVLALGIQWFSASEYNNRSIRASSEDVQKTAGIETPLPQPGLLPGKLLDEHTAQIDASISKQHTGKDDIERPAESGTNNVMRSNSGTSDQLPNDNQQLNDAQEKIPESSALSKEQPKKPADDDTVNNAELSIQKTIAPQQTAIVAEEQEEDSFFQNDGEQWLRKQPPDNYTLQLMVLAKEQSIKDILKKYPLLEQDVRPIKSVVNGKVRFILLYGSFTSFSLAIQSKKSLPSEFRHSVITKVSAIKK